MRNRARRALLAGLVLLPALAIASPARADSVSDWNATAAAALQAPGTAVPPGAGQGAISGVHLAMVHGAVYDAVNAIAGGHEPLPLLARGRALVLAGRRGRRCRAPRAAQRRAQRSGRVRRPPHHGDRGCLPEHTRRDPRRAGRGRRHRHRRGRRDRDAGGAGRRRPLPARTVHVPDRDAAGRSGARRRVRQRPRRLAEGRPAVRAAAIRTCSARASRMRSTRRPMPTTSTRSRRSGGRPARQQDAAPDGRGELLGR